MELTSTVRKALVVLSLLFVSACSWSIFIYSFFQIGDTEADQSGYQIDCSSTPWDSNRPLRYSYTPDSAYVECGWSWSHTITRLSVAAVGGVFPFLSIIFGILRKKKWVLWTTSLLCIVEVGLYVGIIVYDCKDLSHSLSWCKDYVNNGDCSYLPYFGMVTIEAIIIVIWLLEAIGVLYYTSRHMGNDFSSFKFDYTDDNSYYSS